MIMAEWSGKRVTLYTDTKIQFRQINVPHNVVGVQVSGDSRTDAMVSIAMDNGRIMEIGTHEELMHRRGYYYHLYSSQE